MKIIVLRRGFYKQEHDEQRGIQKEFERKDCTVDETKYDAGNI